MSDTRLFSPSLTLFQPDKPHELFTISLPVSKLSKTLISSTKFHKTSLKNCCVCKQGEGTTLQEDLDDSSPVSVQLQTICNETHFDKVLADAQLIQQPVIIVWMASWCRKCIYLKPKLEKLAADYYPRLQFYRVDVNTVPHKLVARAGVTLWKDNTKQAEVIGGHKGYLVANEVREMIENNSSL